MWQAELPASSSTAEQAVELCANLELGDHCDWRVPSRVEVASLMDSEENPPIEALLSDGRYLGTGWGINNSLWAAGTKGIFLELKDGEEDGVGWVHCVRVHSPPRVKAHSFSIQGEGDEQVVYDAATDLSWKYADPVVELPQAQAGPYCQSITAAGGGFRLASVKELMTIFDEARPETEHIDPAFFPLQLKYWDKVAWTTPLDVEKASWLFNFTIRSSYQIAGQVSVSPYDERLVFCVK